MSARQKRIRITILLLAVFVLVGIFYSFWSNREPRYQGQSLSYWYQEYCRPLTGANAFPGPGRRAEALEALRHIGTNALPYLVDLAFSTNRDSAARSNLVSFANGFRRFWNIPESPTSEQLHREAAPLIRELKPPASALIPLLQTYSRSTNLATNSLSLYLLGGVGDGVEDAVPYLAASLKQPRLASSLSSLESLEHLGAASRSAVPALVQFLEALKGTNFVEGLLAGIPGISTNNIPRMALSLKNQWLYSAAKTLGSIGRDAAPAVPLLLEFFETRTNKPTRTELAFALCRIDPGQTNALAYLVTSLEQRTNAWYAAAQHLGDLGTNARVAVPVLFGALSDTNASLRTEAALALKKIGLPTAEFVPKLKGDLQSKDPTTQFRVAVQILQVDPADHDAHLVLINYATNLSQLRYSAVSELGKAGPAAKEAIPALRELLKSNDRRLRNEAAEALRIIEAREPPK